MYSLLQQFCQLLTFGRSLSLSSYHPPLINIFFLKVNSPNATVNNSIALAHLIIHTKFNKDTFPFFLQQK